jgi:glycosyltransferase involved in cell wall biosynthesis
MSGDQEPAVSVIIPLYNKEKYVRRAVESVLGQTFVDFELIVVNDGSTDGGPVIVRGYTDPRIRVIDQDNHGVSAARNRGIAEARAPLTAFLDADDEWLPEFLMTIVGMTRRFPEAGAYATASEIHESSGAVTRLVCDGFGERYSEGIIENYCRTALLGCQLSSSAVAVPRHVFERVGDFPIGEHLGEDGHMWLRIALRYPIAYSACICSVYHREAEGRSCVNRNARSGSGDNFQLVELAREAISDGLIGDSERNYLQEYCAKYTIAAATDHVLWGRGGTARALLLCCKTRRFFCKKWGWFALSLLPAHLVNRMWQWRLRFQRG